MEASIPLFDNLAERQALFYHMERLVQCHFRPKGHVLSLAVERKIEQQHSISSRAESQALDSSHRKSCEAKDHVGGSGLCRFFNDTGSGFTAETRQFPIDTFECV